MITQAHLIMQKWACFFILKKEAIEHSPKITIFEFSSVIINCI
jgi:hypothetical protein